MKYKSTRGDKNLYTFSETVLKGIAPDGGLFIPQNIPHISLAKLKSLQNKTYQEIISFVFDLFELNLDKQDIDNIITKAYGKNFDDPVITPVKHFKNNQYMLELWHGRNMCIQRYCPTNYATSFFKSSRNG